MYKKLLACILVVGALSVSLVSTASAHVVVLPDETLTASFLTFTVSAPNEKEVAFNSVKLLIPSGLKYVTPSVKNGWQVNVEKDGEGESATVKSITWSGNSVPAGFREDFTFSGQAPAEPTDLQWKAYQTYENGETVAWDLAEDKQPKNADGSPDFSKSGPFSVTKVVKEPEASAQTTEAINKAEQAAVDAKDSANRAMYIGIAGVVLALIAIFLATRKKA